MRPPRTLGGILHPPSAGNKYSGGTPPKGHRSPVRFGGFKPPSGVKTMGGGQPVTIMRTNEHHGGRH
ncbi:MAG: hypothetical protein ACREDL_06475 [Bradyrhizobium sp.]